MNSKKRNRTRMHLGLLLNAAFFIAACGSNQTQSSVHTSDQITANESIDDAALRHPHVYVCDGGETIRAAYPDTDTAVVEYKGETHVLHIAVSADGARYINDHIEWWSKGSGSEAVGSLFAEHDGHYSTPLETNCRAE